MTTKKEEALSRMRAFGLMDSIVREFEREGTVYYSEAAGILYWVSNEPSLAQAIRDFEEREGALVYHVVLSRTELGKCWSFLFVGNNEEEWELDREGIGCSVPFAYVWNEGCPCFSEFGSIGIRPMNGGLRRIA